LQTNAKYLDALAAIDDPTRGKEAPQRLTPLKKEVSRPQTWLRTRHVCTVGEAREVLMHVGGPGLWTGEYGLLSGARSVGSVVADAPTQALYLSAVDWQRIVDEEPRWLTHFAALVAERFAAAYRAYADAQAMTRDEWVYARLQLVAQVEREHGSPVPRIQLSQLHLASMVGVSRQTLNAALMRLQSRGLLRVGFRTIELAE
jgi:CRP/FNR family cyclic AMP-dependent transcriptional regulator